MDRDGAVHGNRTAFSPVCSDIPFTLHLRIDWMEILDLTANSRENFIVKFTRSEHKNGRGRALRGERDASIQ